MGDNAEGQLDVFNTKNTILPNEKTKVVIMNAPKIPVTVNNGDVYPCWFDILDTMDVMPRINEVHLA